MRSTQPEVLCTCAAVEIEQRLVLATSGALVPPLLFNAFCRKWLALPWYPLRPELESRCRIEGTLYSAVDSG